MKRIPLTTPSAVGFVGFIAGLVLGGWSMWPDLVRRVRWSWSGGGGESADWGEPLFYLLIVGLPVGVVVGLGGFVVTACVQWFASKDR